MDVIPAKAGISLYTKRRVMNNHPSFFVMPTDYKQSFL